MKKIVMVISVVFLNISTKANDGSLDPTFGTAGLVTTNFGGGSLDEASAALLQPDGKIVATGFSDVSGTRDFALTRYNPNGTLDSSFGTAGLVTTNFGGSSNDEAAAVLLQPDGKIVAVGFSNASGNNDFALAWYNPDGSSDSSVGTAGLVTTNFGGSSSDRAFAALLQPDGKIVAIGQSNVSGTLDFALARYNPNGTLDSSFGTAGLVTTNFGGSSTDTASAALLQPDGKIVVAGSSNVSGDDFALARYNPNGTLDSSFGTAGLVTTNFGGTDFVNGALLQPDGKIVAVGFSNASGIDFALARYNPNGSLDSSFGTAGLVVTTDFGGSDDQAFQPILQPDGKIVAVGFSNASGTRDFALARYKPDGTLDGSFGSAGLVTTNFGVGSGDLAFTSILQSDGKIVAVGTSTGDFALARYLIPSITISKLARDLRAKYFLLQ